MEGPPLFTGFYDTYLKEYSETIITKLNSVTGNTEISHLLAMEMFYNLFKRDIPENVLSAQIELLIFEETRLVMLDFIYKNKIIDSFFPAAMEEAEFDDLTLSALECATIEGMVISSFNDCNKENNDITIFEF